MLFISMLVGCSASIDTPNTFGTWIPIWEDQFEGEFQSPPNPEFWEHDIGGDGWGNNQLEYNTDSIENVRLSGNGTLEIIAQREEFQGNQYTSGRIKTQHLLENGYGRYEARIRLPEGEGLWPAFWLLGADIDDGQIWPSCGEIDILEMRGDDPFKIHGTIHGPGYAGVDSIGGTFESENSIADDFHIFRVDFDPGYISWYVDDQLYLTITEGNIPSNSAWVFDHDFFMILNLAVGGNYLSDPTPEANFPKKMEIDYVRIYERSE